MTGIDMGSRTRYPFIPCADHLNIVAVQKLLASPDPIKIRAGAVKTRTVQTVSVCDKS
jgi:hypothetical protein